jgi:ATP-binding cassette subfamily B protein
LAIFSIFVSLIELFGIGVIMPFISIATDFDKIFENKYFAFLYHFFNFSSPLEFVVVFGVFLIVFYIFRAIINFSYFYLLSRFSQGRYYTLAYRLFRNYLKMYYIDFIERKSSELTKTIINEANNLVYILSLFLFIMSEVFVAFFITLMLIYVNWKMTLLLALFLGVNIFILKKIITPRVKRAGVVRNEMQERFYDVMFASFGNFKMIKLKGNEEELLKEFQKASKEYTKAQILSLTFGHLPRLYLEAISFSLVAFIIVYLVLKAGHNIATALPILSVFVLGLYRLMPSVNRIYTSYNNILYHLKALEKIHSDLLYAPEDLGDEKVEFKKEIKLQNISFEYKKNKPILKDINLTIKKGEKVGIVGESGSGKSTLIDLIIGLYKPKDGKILIDEKELSEKNMKSWRKKIGYIPQHIYLFDGTIAENVAFGEEIDEEKVKKALKMANLLDFLEKEHEGIYTKVGENGVKLSGGQKQRVAIARALYNNPEILILDEATSALDNETEKKIMDEIYKIGEDKTMIIVAHRLSTLDRCTRIIKLDKGKIVE